MLVSLSTNYHPHTPAYLSTNCFHTRLLHKTQITHLLISPQTAFIPICFTKHRSHTSFLQHTDSHANHLMEGAEVIQEIPALVLKNLIDRSYEKRKAAAGEIESIIHQMHVTFAVIAFKS